ncbi:MAG TPA: hypothetical protein PLF11_09250 [Bacillota bacterium]|nr:hypothetical protein [Verrucomicrobiota bacterium]OQC68468.1 MAG: hypothetical protein BWX48_00016 [Verrucomicrobia bacterium ADurb.Bin006]HOI37555.1 hypothetical protein [Bacillota bacterium]
MNPDGIKKEFDDAAALADSMQAKYANAVQMLGRLSSVISTTQPYWTQLAIKGGNDPAAISAIQSGVANVAAIKGGLYAVDASNTCPTGELTSLCLSASSFGTDTAAISSLLPLAPPCQFKVDLIPLPEFTQNNGLAQRLSKLDPSLGKVCAEVWETLYGTTADPERSALYMIRQTWDHLFDRLAPDAEVRKSSHWTTKDVDKKDMVTREERIKYAVDRHVSEPTRKNLLLATCDQMVDLYQELNRAHERGEVNAEKAIRTLHAIYAWLQQWADALNL